MRGPNRAVTSVCWSPDGQQVAAGSGDTRAYVWKVSGLPEPESIKKKEDVRSIQQEWHRLDAHTAGVTSLVWRHDLKIMTGLDQPCLATSSSDGSIVLWDPSNGRRKHKFYVPARTARSADDDDDYDSDDDGASVKARERARRAQLLQAVNDMAWCADGTQLVTGHLDGMMRIVSLEGAILHAWKAHGEVIRCVAVSCVGLISSCSHDSTIAIWCPNTSASIEVNQEALPGEATVEATEEQALVKAMSEAVSAATMVVTEPDQADRKPSTEVGDADEVDLNEVD